MITPVLRSAMSPQRSATSRLSTIQRHLSTTSATRKVERLTVFGAGLMGSGIAQVGAQNGLKVGIRTASELVVVDLWLQVILADVTDKALE